MEVDWDIIEELIEKDPFINFLGIKTKVISEGKVEARLDLRENHMRTGGMMNGGAISTLIDTAGGMAVLTLSKKNQVTVNLNINFLRPISVSPARAVGEVLKKGKNIFYVKVEAFDGENKLCAFATGTWFILED
jgi:uncharacterized protein (TIGR00369 family)